MSKFLIFLIWKKKIFGYVDIKVNNVFYLIVDIYNDKSGNKIY